MIRMLSAVLALLVFLSACTSNTKTQTPEFRTSQAAIDAAAANLMTSTNDILFLLMVNRDGKVEKAKVLKTKINRRDIKPYRRVMYGVEFTKASESDPEFREFLFPYNVPSPGEPIENMPSDFVDMDDVKNGTF